MTLAPVSAEVGSSGATLDWHGLHGTLAFASVGDLPESTL